MEANTGPDGKLKSALTGGMCLLLAACACGDSRTAANIAQVRQEVVRSGLWEGASLACYIVPAVSPLKRLPDVIPTDGKLGNRIRVIAAQGEFEPASFVVFPFKDVSALDLKVSALTGAGGKIDAGNVDVKVVKCWYQAGTAWQSYFPDPDRKALVPELLLNDETLVRVDVEEQANYLRLDYPEGRRYVWMSSPSAVDPPHGDSAFFNVLREPLSDSPTLLPVELATGKGKQFWLTLRVPDHAVPGLYSGTIDLSAGGKRLGRLTLDLRVLPFSLPDPRTYYDLDEEFLVSIYPYIDVATHLRMNDDVGVVKTQILAALRDMRDHSVKTHRFCAGLTEDGGTEHMEIFADLLEAAGVNLDMMIGPYGAWDNAVCGALQRGEEPDPEQWQRFVAKNEKMRDFLKKRFPDTTFYALGRDEAWHKSLSAESRTFRYFADKGIGNYATAHLKNLLKAGVYNIDIFNTPFYAGETSEKARLAHASGTRLLSYASPHSGPENPALIRRTHGLMLYKSDYDGVKQCGYHPQLWYHNCWNDFAGPSDCYRINFVYPTRDGVIDTLHWEGFREAIDDVRYATKLCLLARDAVASGDVSRRYDARKALQYLAELDWRRADLDAARLEMIHYILELQPTMKGGDR